MRASKCLCSCHGATAACGPTYPQAVQVCPLPNMQHDAPAGSCRKQVSTFLFWHALLHDFCAKGRPCRQHCNPTEAGWVLRLQQPQVWQVAGIRANVEQTEQSLLMLPPALRYFKAAASICLLRMLEPEAISSNPSMQRGCTHCTLCFR